MLLPKHLPEQNLPAAVVSLVVSDSFLTEISNTLQNRREQHLYRSRRVINASDGRHVLIDNKQLLSFCSNDYLGLSQHPDIRKAMQEGVNRFGVGSGAAHLISGHNKSHHALEEELADFVQRPRALLFSTGYMANLGTVQALLGKNDAVFEDRLNHASLIDAGLGSGARFQRYLHCDTGSLNNMLDKSEANKKLVVTDGVFSMDGDLAPLDQLASCARQNQAWLMVDDAHGIGINGKQGRGTLNQFGLTTQDVPVLMATCGKAMGTFGAFVAGEDELIEYLIQEARTYIYTTAFPPALAEATRKSIEIIRRDEWRRDKLQQLVDQFQTGAKQLGLTVTDSSTPIQPVTLGNNEKALATSQHLYDKGILVTAIRPPSVPANSARLRITFSALHEPDDIELLLSHLEHCA